MHGFGFRYIGIVSRDVCGVILFAETEAEEEWIKKFKLDLNVLGQTLVLSVPDTNSEPELADKVSSFLKRAMPVHEPAMIVHGKLQLTVHNQSFKLTDPKIEALAEKFPLLGHLITTP